MTDQHPDQGASALVPPDFRALCAKVIQYNEGQGKYNFSHLDRLDREDAAFDAWQEIRSEIKHALAQPVPPGPTDDELLDVADLRDACNAQAVAALAALKTLADAVDQFGPAGGADGRALAAEVEKARKFLDCAAALHPAHAFPTPGDNQQ